MVPPPSRGASRSTRPTARSARALCDLPSHIPLRAPVEPRAGLGAHLARPTPADSRARAVRALCRRILARPDRRGAPSCRSRSPPVRTAPQPVRGERPLRGRTRVFARIQRLNVPWRRVRSRPSALLLAGGIAAALCGCGQRATTTNRKPQSAQSPMVHVALAAANRARRRSARKADVRPRRCSAAGLWRDLNDGSPSSWRWCPGRSPVMSVSHPPTCAARGRPQAQQRERQQRTRPLRGTRPSRSASWPPAFRRSSRSGSLGSGDLVLR